MQQEQTCPGIEGNPPRLELLAALVGARLLNYFCRATCIDITEATLWSDSTVALGWIRQDPNGWKTFVCNRVTAEQLKIMDVWWCGPSWLAQLPRHWPPNTPPVDVSFPKGKGPPNKLCLLRFARNCWILRNTAPTGSYLGSQHRSCASGKLPFERRESPVI